MANADARAGQFEHALGALRASILNGELISGQRVSEAATAARLGVSRTPMREAIARLVEEGLLVRSASGRCSVCSITRADVLDALELRGLIEGAAARLAAERGAQEDALDGCAAVLTRIDDALGARVEDIDFPRYSALNQEFHERVAALAGSPLFVREAERISRIPLAGPSAFTQGMSADPGVLASLALAQSQHRALLEAISAREGARAEAIAREHARLARRNLDYFLFESPAPTRTIPELSLVREVRSRIVTQHNSSPGLK